MKALALISGGLDSLLAALVIKAQGIEVIGVKFKIPFYKRKVLDIPGAGFEVKEIDLGEYFLEVIRNPRYGFGSNMNPCIDCKILMLKKAKEIMPSCGAQFVITGEVLGQRPMSQHKEALINIGKKSGLEGLLVRPLSARLLSATTPEKEGWISRDKLLDISGRSRKRQLELVKEFGIGEFAQPAGGCLLTDPGFSVRLKELMGHGEISFDNVELLKIGRHFRLSARAKLIVGRNEEEDNDIIALAREKDYLFLPQEEIAGPTALGRGEFNDALIEASCRIVARYCDRPADNSVGIVYRRLPDAKNTAFLAQPAPDEEMSAIRI